MTPEQDEDARIRSHLTRALARCVADSHGRSNARRAEALGALRAYIAAGRFPRNRVGNAAVPVFVDGDGARCAVAAMMEATGEHALVERIARTRNLADVDELRHDPAVGRWLARHGLSALDAACIQPAYHAYTDAHWQPTVSVVAYADAGGHTRDGLETAVGAGVRAGVRRVIRGSTDNGNSVYGSVALMLEYDRHVVIAQGAAHRLALLAQWEPDGNHGDVQGYFLGGVALSLDDDAAPGTGAGVRVGGGVSFRTRTVPWLAELVAETLALREGVALHLALNVGLVW